MPDFVDTTTLSIHQSTSEAEALPSFVVVAHADAVSWSAIPQKYRKWDGSAIVEMTAPEKAVVDAAESQSLEDTQISQLDMKTLLTAEALVILDQVNVIRAALVPPKVAITPQQFKNAIRTKYQSLGA